jgi:D-alanyl-D-alanine carboxypeptidase
MLQRYPGADGIKTGYIETAGHNLVTSAVRGNVRLIGVVLGASSNPERDQHMAALLDAGFERFDIPPMTAREWQARETPRGQQPQVLASAQTAPLPAALHQAAIRGPSATPPFPPPGLPPEAPRPPRQAAASAGAASWGVQVGAFSSEGAARQAAVAARRAVGDGDPRVEQIVFRGHSTWRAQLVGMNEAEMHGAMASLARRRIPAQPIHVDGERLASR